MKTLLSLKPQYAFWGICLVALAWIAASIFFEIHLGWPATALALAKRIVGWCVELWLVRTLIVGSRRCAAATKAP